MALSLDGTAKTGTASTASSIASAALVYSTAGNILVAVIAVENNTATVVRTVSNVTSTSGVTWARRKQTTATNMDDAAGGTNGLALCVEIWWAYNPSTSAGDTVTATLSGTMDDSCIVAFAVKGFSGTAYQTAPWDVNASLTATQTTTNSVGGATSPSVTPVTTTSTSGMLLGLYGSGSVAVQKNLGITGYSSVGSVYNGGGSLDCEATVYSKTYASAQSATTVTWSAVTGMFGWIAMVDALNDGGASDTLFAQSWG